MRILSLALGTVIVAVARVASANDTTVAVDVVGDADATLQARVTEASSDWATMCISPCATMLAPGTAVRVEGASGASP